MTDVSDSNESGDPGADESRDWLGDRPYPNDLRAALFGGDGSVRVWDLLAGRSLGGFSAALACELGPGASVGRHQQQRDPQIVLCAQGDGEIEVGGHWRAFPPGEIVLLPFACTLAIRNSSPTKALRYFIIKVKDSSV